MLSGIQSALRLSLDAIKMKSTFSLFTFTLYSRVTHFCTNRESVLRVEPRPAVTHAVGGPVRVGGLGDPSRVPRRPPVTDALQGSPSWVVLKKLPEEGRI